MPSPRFFVASLALVLGSCNGSITFRSTIDYAVDLDMYSMSFTNSGLAPNNTISSVTCTPGTAGDTFCQAIADGANSNNDIVVKCNAMSRCDPEPYRLVVDLGVQDLVDLTTAHVSVLDHLELIDVDAIRDTNTTNFDVPASELRWGSESASVANLTSSTQQLATVPAMPHASTGPLDITVNAASLDALDTYVRNTSPKIRLFLVTSIDLAPGQALPAGDIAMTVGLIIRASGRLR